jgi:hypothetical protein
VSTLLDRRRAAVLYCVLSSTWNAIPSTFCSFAAKRFLPFHAWRRNISIDVLAMASKSVASWFRQVEHVVCLWCSPALRPSTALLKRQRHRRYSTAMIVPTAVTSTVHRPRAPQGGKQLITQAKAMAPRSRLLDLERHDVLSFYGGGAYHQSASASAWPPTATGSFSGPIDFLVAALLLHLVVPFPHAAAVCGALYVAYCFLLDRSAQVSSWPSAAAAMPSAEPSRPTNPGKVAAMQVAAGLRLPWRTGNVQKCTHLEIGSHLQIRSVWTYVISHASTQRSIWIE